MQDVIGSHEVNRKPVAFIICIFSLKAINCFKSFDAVRIIVELFTLFL